MDTPIINCLSLCSGSGQLDIAVETALELHGITARVVGYCEREAASCAVLRSRMEDQALEPAPIWGGNLEDFPAVQFHGLLDAIVAGFPCQPHSVAGARKGRDDERNLLPAILDIADTVGATALFLENVAGLKREFPYIVAQLLQRGWQLEWGTLRASEVGAAHRRERWFCVAYREHIAIRPECRLEPWWWSLAQTADRAMSGAQGDRLLADSECPCLKRPGGAGYVGSACAAHQGAQRSQQRNAADDCQPEILADSISPGLEGHGRHGAGGPESGRIAAQEAGSATEAGYALGDSDSELHDRGGDAGQGRRPQPAYTSLDVADGHDAGRERSRPAEPAGWDCDTLAARGGYRLPIFAPGPESPEWGRILDAAPWLAPALPDGALLRAGHRLLGVSEMETEPALRSLASRLASSLACTRADMLRIVGNGVVPQQAAWAFYQLLTRIKTS